MSHVIITVALQLAVGLAFRNWLLGGLLGLCFYLGREITQAEYRWISQQGAGKRANMPVWGAFDPAVWTAKSVFDIALPAIAVVVIYLLARRWRRSPSASTETHL